MNLRKQVFLSHSSKDKPFVRKLAEDLKTHGYEPWLDEWDLVAGDRLLESIAQAVKRARVLIVVVSPSALRSRWLSHEITLVSDRLVDRRCRVIPIVIDEVDSLPEGLSGLVYVDFRSGYKGGLSKVLRALELEAEAVAAELATQRDSEPREAVREVFGGIGYSSAGGEFEKVPDYDFVTIANPLDRRDPIEVSLHVVHNYGKTLEPLTRYEWENLKDLVAEIASPYALVVTGRPIGLSVGDQMDRASGREGEIAYLENPSAHVYTFTTWAGNWVTLLDAYDEVVAVVEVSDEPEADITRQRLTVARDILTQLTLERLA